MTDVSASSDKKKTKSKAKAKALKAKTAAHDPADVRPGVPGPEPVAYEEPTDPRAPLPPKEVQSPSTKEASRHEALRSLRPTINTHLFCVILPA